MPRFHFHTEDGGTFPDEEGIVLASVADARIQAARMLGEMLKEQPDRFWKDGGLKLTVTDDRGLMLFVLDVATTDAPAGAPPRPTRPGVDGPD
jgi:hypothetical protein